MKRRDLYWLNEILVFLFITLILGIIAIFGVLQFNAKYMEEEQEELQITKKQIEWVIVPLLESKNFSKLQKYCDDFKDKDTELRIFDENKKILALSNSKNQTPLIEKDSNILHSEYSWFKIFEYAIKNKKIGLREEYSINGRKYYAEITISQAEVLKTIINAQKNILIFFGIYTILFIAGIFQTFYTLRNSFNKLEDSVIEIVNGNLETEIQIPRIDLLQELTISIKKMVQSLKLQILRLSQLEHYKSEFLQNITHEIKTPVTAINSAIELIENNGTINEVDKECFNIIQFQIKSITKLVNDILALSEIEVAKTNKHKNFTDVNLNEIAKDVMYDFSYSSIKINLIASAEINIKGDKELLKMAISNLVSNAVKYSQSDKIEIILNKQNEKVEIIVQDYGTGIPHEHINHLFERFYRIDKARSRSLGGSGLGLAIVKNIISLHNGIIDVKSEVGKGTSFICKL